MAIGHKEVVGGNEVKGRKGQMIDYLPDHDKEFRFHFMCNVRPLH